MKFFSENRIKRRIVAAGSDGPVVVGDRAQEKLDALLTVCRNNLSSIDEDLITRAFEFSLTAHKTHLKKYACLLNC